MEESPPRAHHDMGGVSKFLCESVDTDDHALTDFDRTVDALRGLLGAKRIMSVDELRRGIDDRAVARDIRLARQDVHRLRAGDAWHQFHRESRGPAVREGLERVDMAVGVEDGDEQCAGLQTVKGVRRRAAHLQNDIGIADRIRGRVRDRGALRLVITIEDTGFEARAGLDDDFGPERVVLAFDIRLDNAGTPRVATALSEKVWLGAAVACAGITAVCFLKMYLWFSIATQ